MQVVDLEALGIQVCTRNTTAENIYEHRKYGITCITYIWVGKLEVCNAYPLPKYGLGTIIVQVLEMQLLRVSTKGENIEIPCELSLAFTASDAGRR